LEKNINKVYLETIKANEIPSANLLKSRLLNHLNNDGNNNPIKNVEKQTLTEYFEKIIETKKGTVSKTTIHTYNQTLDKLKTYEKQNNIYLEFKHIDLNFYDDYKSFLEGFEYSPSTIAKHFKKLKAVLNQAILEGLTNNQAHKSKRFQAKEEQGVEIYLNEDEIQSMLNKDLSYNKKFELARDIFLIGYYTGQRVSDYNNFSKDLIVKIDGMEYLKFIQKKNFKHKKYVYCPITKEMKDIMKRYKNDFPPKMLDKDINLYIKDVGRICKIKDTIKVDYTRGGKHYTDYKPKHKMIGTHTARRSFATNMYKKGMPVYDIMLFTGHTTEKEFYKYIRIKDEERASHVVKAGYFNV
jgi:integrase